MLVHGSNQSMVVTQLAHKQIDIIHGLGYGSQLMESPLRSLQVGSTCLHL